MSIETNHQSNTSQSMRFFATLLNLSLCAGFLNAAEPPDLNKSLLITNWVVPPTTYRLINGKIFISGSGPGWNTIRLPPRGGGYRYNISRQKNGLFSVHMDSTGEGGILPTKNIILNYPLRAEEWTGSSSSFFPRNPLYCTTYMTNGITNSSVLGKISSYRFVYDCGLP